jgi:hypothetical protein
VTVTDIFRDIKVATDVEKAALMTLEAWMSTYLREIELQQNLPQDAIPEPTAYLIAEEVDNQHGDRLPMLVALSPGLSRPPQQTGNGSFRATFALGISIIASAAERDDNKYLIRLYSAVIRAIMLQRQSLGGVSNGIAWIDETYDDNLTFADNLTVHAGTVTFEVEVDDTVNRFAGPTTPMEPDPDTQPGMHWPVAETHTVTVKHFDE